MARFKPGQEVVCIVNGEWWQMRKFLFFWKKKFNIPYAPKFNEIVTVAANVIDKNGEAGLYLCEYPVLIGGNRPAYQEAAFNPILPSSIIAELFEETQLTEHA